MTQQTASADLSQTFIRFALDAGVLSFGEFITKAGRKSPYSLYDTKLATYTEEDQFDHKSSVGFIQIYGLPVKTFYQVNKKLLKK